MAQVLTRPKLEDIESNISRLGYSQLLLCGLVVCERLLPSYVAFSGQTNRGDPEYLKSVLGGVWGGVSQSANPYLAKSFSRQTSALIPDSDEFPGPLAGLAQFAVAAICHLLEGSRAGTIEHIARIRMLALDSIDLTIQATTESLNPLAGGGDFEAEWARIDGDPLMQSEIERQRQELEQISLLDGIDQDVLFRLRADAQSKVLFDVSILISRPSR